MADGIQENLDTEGVVVLVNPLADRDGDAPRLRRGRGGLRGARYPGRAVGRARAWTRDDVRARIAAQLPLEERSRAADVLLDNEGTLDELRARGRRALARTAPTGPPLPSERRRYPSAVRFRAVFFDAGETLVHPSPSFPELFSRVIVRRGGHPREPVAVSDASVAVFPAFGGRRRDGELWTTSPERSAPVLEGRVRADARDARPARRRWAAGLAVRDVHRPGELRAVRRRP